MLFTKFRWISLILNRLWRPDDVIQNARRDLEKSRGSWSDYLERVPPLIGHVITNCSVFDIQSPVTLLEGAFHTTTQVAVLPFTLTSLRNLFYWKNWKSVWLTPSYLYRRNRQLTKTVTKECYIFKINNGLLSREDISGVLKKNLL